MNDKILDLVETIELNYVKGELKPGTYHTLDRIKTLAKESTMDTYAFELLETVKISCSDEEGVIIGRNEYSAGDTNYLIRYKAADGRAVESWWNESALENKG